MNSNMPNNILNKTQYDTLLMDIKDIIALNKRKMEELSKFQLVLTYWQIGKRISKEKLSNNANYSSLILEDLTKDLNLERSTLSRSVQFFHIYPNKLQISNLTWSHYKSLLTIKDDKLRLKLEEKAKKENWNVSKLRTIVQNSKLNNDISSDTTINRPIEPNYLYKARIINVIDGDTLLVEIDLGFAVLKKQRVRLNNINAEDIKTKEGKKAFKYLRDLVARLEIIVVKTKKIDIYGRYLADIFYLPYDTNNQTTQIEIFNDGIYLNEKLVSEGVVKIA